MSLKRKCGEELPPCFHNILPATLTDELEVVST
jgi:hypothetical protein